MQQQKVEKNALQATKDTLQAEEQNLMVSLKTAREQGSAHDNTPTHTAESWDVGKKSQADGTAGVAIILERMLAYFAGRAREEDLHIFSFSLQHLFTHMDYLYRHALPALLQSSLIKMTPALSPMDDLLYQHTMWTKLRSIKQTLNRVEPLGHLLNDAAERILDALDLTGDKEISHEELTLHGASCADDQEWLLIYNHERWNLAVANLTETLHCCQEAYSQNSLFKDYFAQVLPSIPALVLLDDVFTTLLDCTGAIFGDILLNFQALSPGDDEIAATLLFDLMQQVDQLLLQIDRTLEPLHALTEHFALILHC
ncbi:MAG: hypothetical protein ACJ788_11645 [Ktedonobacteraceae bacterium]